MPLFSSRNEILSGLSIAITLKQIVVENAFPGYSLTSKV